MPLPTDSAMAESTKCIHYSDNMTQNKLSSVIGVSLFLGLIVIFFAGVIGISTPFVAFSYFVLAIGLLLIAVAEIGFFLLIVTSAATAIKDIMKEKNEEES